MVPSCEACRPTSAAGAVKCPGRNYSTELDLVGPTSSARTCIPNRADCEAVSRVRPLMRTRRNAASLTLSLLSERRNPPLTSKTPTPGVADSAWRPKRAVVVVGESAVDTRRHTTAAYQLYWPSRPATQLSELVFRAILLPPRNRRLFPFCRGQAVELLLLENAAATWPPILKPGPFIDRRR